MALADADADAKSGVEPQLWIVNSSSTKLIAEIIRYYM